MRYFAMQAAYIDKVDQLRFPKLRVHLLYIYILYADVIKTRYLYIYLNDTGIGCTRENTIQTHNMYTHE